MGVRDRQEARVEPEAGVVRLSGDLGIESEVALERALRSLAEPDRPLVLDMSGVRFIDSVGLRVLLRISRERTVVIRERSASVDQLLRMAGVDQMFRED